jgi:hypothetical protein
MRKQAAALSKSQPPPSTPSQTTSSPSPSPQVIRVSLKKHPSPGPPAEPPSPPNESGDGELLELLDDMSTAEGRAAGVEREQQDCPSCGNAMPADAVICLHCGYNKQLGRRMGDAQIDVGAAPPTEKTKARRDPRPPTAARSTVSPEGKEWLLGVIPIAVFVTLFFFARGSPAMALAFFGSQFLFALVVHILVLVSAFRSGTLQGFLCLCLPFYALYWVFVESENPALKWAYGAAAATNIVTRVLDFESMVAMS